MNDRAAHRIALLDYKRSMHVAHRQLQQSMHDFVRGIEEQFAQLRHQRETIQAARQEQACRAVLASHTPRVVESTEGVSDDQTHPSAQESR